MKVWLHHRPGEAMYEGNRVVVICPETENVILDCSRSFFDKEIELGRIRKINEQYNGHAN